MATPLSLWRRFTGHAADRGKPGQCSAGEAEGVGQHGGALLHLGFGCGGGCELQYREELRPRTLCSKQLLDGFVQGVVSTLGFQRVERLIYTTRASNSAQAELIFPNSAMSLVTKDLFKRIVIAQQSAYTEQLSLYPPVFEDDGFITTAFMSSYSGKVELRCGPAEYHVELFVHDDPGVNRRTLSELIALPIVREWMKANRADLEGKHRVEAEVAYAFRLLNEAIARVPEMNWLRRKPKP